MEAKHMFFGPCSPHHPSTPCSACSGSLAWPAGQSELSSLVLAHLLSLLVFSSRVLTSFLTCHMGLMVLFPTYLCPCSSPTKLLIVADQALLSLAPAHLSRLGFPGGSAGFFNPPAMGKTWVRSLGWEDSSGEGTATHSSILAWRTPWTL